MAAHPLSPLRRLAFVLAIVLVPLGRAAAIERDLGEGLVYFRVHQVPVDLPSEKALRKRPCVLDLRFATADATGADVLASWLKFHANRKTPLLVLVNGATAPAVQAALQPHDPASGLVTFGLLGQKFEPDITVTDTAANERQAYQALEKGASVAKLTTDHPEKPRNDEATLAHERPADPADSEVPAAADKPAAKAPPPVIDSVLQRAIQVHRGLRALKRI